MLLRQIAGLIRVADRKADGYSRDLSARLRASYQRDYFAPALFNLIPVRTDLDRQHGSRCLLALYYHESWLATHSVEENAALLIHEVSPPLRDHEARKKAAAHATRAGFEHRGRLRDQRRLVAEGLPFPHDPPQPGKYGSPLARRRSSITKRSTSPSTAGSPITRATAARARMAIDGRGSCPPDGETSGGTPVVDAMKAECAARCRQRIMDLPAWPAKCRSAGGAGRTVDDAEGRLHGDDSPHGAHRAA